MEVVLLVSRYTPGQEDGINPGIRLDKADDILPLHECQRIHWLSPKVAVESGVHANVPQVDPESLETRLA